MSSTTRPLGVSLPVPTAWALAIAEFDDDRKLARKSPRSRMLWRAHLAQLARWMDQHQDGLGPFEQTRASLGRYMATMDDWSRSTMRSHRTTFIAFYDWATDVEHMVGNPARKLPKVPHTAPKPRPASDMQFLHALTKSDGRTQLMVHLANDLGLRATEISQIHSRDLREVGGRLLLTVHGKGEKDRTLPCPPVLGAMLLALPAGWAFPSDRHPSGHLQAAYVSKLLSRVLPGATGHQLRHRFATATYQQNGDLLLVSQLLGHSSTAITQGYVLSDNLAKMAEAIDRNASQLRELAG